MNDETLKFIKIIISKGSSVPGGVTRSRYQVACGERNIQQRGVFKNGEGGRSGDEEEEESCSLGRRFWGYEINIKSGFNEYSCLVSNFFLCHSPN